MRSRGQHTNMQKTWYVSGGTKLKGKLSNLHVLRDIKQAFANMRNFAVAVTARDYFYYNCILICKGTLKFEYTYSTSLSVINLIWICVRTTYSNKFLSLALDCVYNLVTRPRSSNRS